MSEKRRRIVITIVGSAKDDAQTKSGLGVLIVAQQADEIGNLNLAGRRIHRLDQLGTGHYVISCHRNDKTLCEFIELIAAEAEGQPDTDFILVMAAGWAAALPGVAAGQLYNRLGANNVFVVAVALESEITSETTKGGGDNVVLNDARTAVQIFMGLTPKQRRDLAAVLSITEVPGNLMITGDERGLFFGAEGFHRACQFAVRGEIPAELRAAIAAAPGKVPLPQFRPWE